MMMVRFINPDDDDSKDLAVIEDQALGAPEENRAESKKKVTIINFVRKRAQVSVVPPQKPNENSSTRKESKKSSEKKKRQNKSELIKRPPKMRQERNEITSKSAEHSFKSRSEKTVHRSVHSTAFKSVAAGSFTLEPSVQQEFHPLPPPLLPTKKARRQYSIFEDKESDEESMKGMIIDQIRPNRAIAEEREEEDEGKSIKEKKKTSIKPEEIAQGGRKKLADIEEVHLNNTGKQLCVFQS